MDYTITITGDELVELQRIVAQIQTDQPALNMTEAKYVNSLVLQYLRQRVRDSYVTYLRGKTLDELKVLLPEARA